MNALVIQSLAVVAMISEERSSNGRRCQYSFIKVGDRDRPRRKAYAALPSFEVVVEKSLMADFSLAVLVLLAHDVMDD